MAELDHSNFFAEVVWLGWITFTYSWPSLIKCACFCWAWSPLRRYDWPRSLLFVSLTWSLLRPYQRACSLLPFVSELHQFLWYLADVEHLCPRDVSLGDNVRIYCQYNCTVQPLSPLQGLLDQKKWRWKNSFTFGINAFRSLITVAFLLPESPPYLYGWDWSLSLFLAELDI